MPGPLINDPNQPGGDGGGHPGGGGGNPTTPGNGGGNPPTTPPPPSMPFNPIAPTPYVPEPPKTSTRKLIAKSPPTPHGDDFPPPSTPLPKYAKPDRSRRTTTFVPPTGQVVPVIYGERKHVPGLLLYEKEQPDGSLIALYLVCWGPINNIFNIVIDNTPIAAFGTSVNIHLGTASQTVDTIIGLAEPLRVTSGFPYMAYVVAKFPKPAPGQSSPNWRNFFCDVRGKLVYDHRTDATLTTKFYRDNPALCAADWATSTQYGMGQPTTNVYNAALTTAADDCDMDIGGGVKRYTCAPYISEKRDAQAWLDDIGATAALQVPWNSGTFDWWVDKAQSVSGIILSDGSDANPGNVIQTGDLRWSGIEDSPSRVRVLFSNQQAQGKDDEQFDDDPAVTVGSSDFHEDTLELHGISTADQAKRIARYRRRKLANDVTLQLRVMSDGLQLLPGTLVQVTTKHANWSLVSALVVDVATSSDPNMPDAFDVTVQPYDAGVYDDTPVSVTNFNWPVSPSPYDPPPEVFSLQINSTSTGYTCWWDAPVALSTQNYGTGFYSQTGCGSYDGTRVSDGNTALKAFDFNVAADSTVTFDAGAGNTKRFRQIGFYGTVDPQFIEYADNGSSWTSLSLGSGLWRVVYPAYAGANLYSWADVGAHRYWRFRKGNTTAQARDAFEVQWFEGTQINTFITHYEVRSGPNVYTTVHVAAIPTSAAPLVLDPITTFVHNADGSGSFSISITVVAVAAFSRSSGISTGTITTLISAGIQSSYQSQSETSLALGNGANQNIAINSTVSLTTITGPTNVFSIGGLAGGFAGQEVTLRYSGTFAATINNEDAGSTAANRIRTFTGANLAFAAGIFTATFRYSGALSRWELVTARDSTGPK